MLLLKKLPQRVTFGLLACFVFCATCLCTAAEAQDLEPRKYVNLPIDQNFLRVAGGYSRGEVELTPGLPLVDSDLKLAGTSLAYLRTLDVGGSAASFDMYMGYFCAQGSTVIDGTRQEGRVCGNGDARARFTWNFIGASALQLGDFVKKEREMVVGASVQVLVPVGQYDENRVLNIGANRWVLRPEIGMSLPSGKWSFEFAAGGRFFQDNDDYVGGSTLEQDPVYNLQAHIVYDLTRRQWLAVDVNYFFGGATFRNDQPTLVKQQNSRFGLTWNVALNSKNVIQLAFSNGVITRVGNDSTNLSLAWVYRWE